MSGCAGSFWIPVRGSRVWWAAVVPPGEGMRRCGFCASGVTDKAALCRERLLEKQRESACIAPGTGNSQHRKVTLQDSATAVASSPAPDKQTPQSPSRAPPCGRPFRAQASVNVCTGGGECGMVVLPQFAPSCPI